jgi:hypothetical protein
VPDGVNRFETNHGVSDESFCLVEREGSAGGEGGGGGELNFVDGSPSTKTMSSESILLVLSSPLSDGAMQIRNG